MEKDISEMLNNKKINRKKMLKWLDVFISILVNYFKTVENKD